MEESQPANVPDSGIIAKIQQDKKIQIGILVAVVVLIVITGFLIFSGKSSKTASKSGTAKSLSLIKKVSYGKQLESTMKATFTSSKEKEVVTYITLATNEKKLDTRYSYYVKAYKKANAIYVQKKDPKMAQALEDLKTYLRAFAQYKASDLS